MSPGRDIQIIYKVLKPSFKRDLSEACSLIRKVSVKSNTFQPDIRPYAHIYRSNSQLLNVIARISMMPTMALIVTGSYLAHLFWHNVKSIFAVIQMRLSELFLNMFLYSVGQNDPHFSIHTLATSSCRSLCPTL